MTNKFDEIRPYNTAELPSVLKLLVSNHEFLNTLVKARFSKWPTFTLPFLVFFIKMYVTNKVSTIHRLSDFQKLVEPYVKRMIKKTTTSLAVSGLDGLDTSKPCLFVSNHRDIALDPAFVNWVLHINGQDTVRIAVGDNLLSEKWIADLIRLNKCFVVQRSVEGRREKLAAAKLLSEYIQHSLKIDKQHIWIAQREGRAKDGIDITNPAIISMFALHKPKSMEFGEYVSQLRIVPVSISYEFDPCDANKAKELCQATKEGRYEKPDNEDMRSIVNGITGQKGRVHVHFGKLVGNEHENAKQVAQYIDDEILDGFCIFSTAQVALDLLNAKLTNKDGSNNTLNNKYNVKQLTAYTYLTNRLESLESNEQETLLAMYANPLLRKQKK